MRKYRLWSLNGMCITRFMWNLMKREAEGWVVDEIDLIEILYITYGFLG